MHTVKVSIFFQEIHSKNTTDKFWNTRKIRIDMKVEMSFKFIDIYHFMLIYNYNY